MRNTHLAHRHYVNVDHGVDELKHKEDNENSASLTLEMVCAVLEHFICDWFHLLKCCCSH